MLRPAIVCALLGCSSGHSIPPPATAPATPAPVAHAPHESPERAAARRRWASATAPSPEHRLDFLFGDSVRLLGYDVDQTQWAAGQRLTVTWYWRCERKLPRGWRLLTHLDDLSRPRTNFDNEGGLRASLPPDAWEPGEYLRDQQTLVLPEDWDAPVGRLYLGLWNDDSNRLPVEPAAGTDDLRRVLALELPTPVPPPPRGSLHVQRVSAPPRIDGNLQDPAWAGANHTDAFVDAARGGAPPDGSPRGEARLLWDDRALYIAVEVSDANLEDPSMGRDQRLWEHDAVDIFLDADADERDYVELMVSPCNHLLDAAFQGPRQPSPFGNLGWNPAVRSAVDVRGTVGSPSDHDGGYTVELAIPWAALRGELPRPPRGGDTLRANLFVLSTDRGSVTATAWSAPLQADFHALSRFGDLVLDP